MLSWTWPGNQQITQSWSGNYAQTGASAVISNASWNGTIAPGATVAGVGFNANYSGANPVPASFSLNGSPCNGAGGSSVPAAPTNLSASAASASQINLSWTASHQRRDVQRLFERCSRFHAVRGEPGRQWIERGL